MFAYKSELEEWLREHADGDGPKTNASHAVGSRTLPATVAVAAAFGAWWGLGLAPFDAPGPFSVSRVADRNLVVADAAGETLWAVSFETPFSEGSIDERPWRIVDLEGDGSREVLFAHHNVAPQPGPEDGLYLYEANGDRRWVHRFGREIEIDGELYADEFKVRVFGTGTLRDGTRFIAVAAVHRPWSPTQVLTLDAEGEVLGEYWNHGYVLDLMTLDVDDDGDDEVLVGGINDVIHKPFVAVLEHDIELTMAPGPRLVPEEMERGKELAYLAFPLSSMARALGVASEVILLRPQGQGFLVETRLSSSGERDRVYSFSRSLKLLKVDFKREFRQRHNEWLEEGRLRVPLEEEHSRMRDIDWLVGR